METTKTSNDYKSVTSHNEDYWEMSTKDRLAQGLFGSFIKSYFDLIHDFMHNKPYFNLPHSQNLMDSKDEMYHTQPYAQGSSPHDDFSFHEEIRMCENAIERAHLPSLLILIPSYTM